MTEPRDIRDRIPEDERSLTFPPSAYRWYERLEDPYGEGNYRILHDYDLTTEELVVDLEAIAMSEGYNAEIFVIGNRVYKMILGRGPFTTKHPYIREYRLLSVRPNRVHYLYPETFSLAVRYCYPKTISSGQLHRWEEQEQGQEQ